MSAMDRLRAALVDAHGLRDVSYWYERKRRKAARQRRMERLRSALVGAHGRRRNPDAVSYRFAGVEPLPAPSAAPLTPAERQRRKAARRRQRAARRSTRR